MQRALSDAKVLVQVRNVAASKVDPEADKNTQVSFNISAKLEESDRKADQVTVSFVLGINGDPKVVRFQVEGIATASGESDDLERLLEHEGDSKVPRIFFSIYEQIYTILFVLAGSIDAPSPSPALLYSQGNLPVEEATPLKEQTEGADPSAKSDKPSGTADTITSESPEGKSPDEAEQPAAEEAAKPADAEKDAENQ